MPQPLGPTQRRLFDALHILRREVLHLSMAMVKIMTAKIAADYVVTLNVLLGTDVSLSLFQVNGSDVVSGDTVVLDPASSEVDLLLSLVILMLRLRLLVVLIFSLVRIR